MKTTPLFRTLLLALLMAAAGNGAMAQETEYHPFADNAIWSVNNIKYATHGDTTICGKNYLKVYRQEEDHPFDFDVEQAEYFCAIRNDTTAQRVYGIYKESMPLYYFPPYCPIESYAPIGMTTDTSEFLLYVFSLLPGDTAIIAAFDDISNAYYEPGIYLYYIVCENEHYYDITLSDNSARRVINVDIPHLSWHWEEWIVGVGNTHGTFSVGASFYGIPKADPHVQLELICYEQDGNMLLSCPWADPDSIQDCFSLGHIGEIEENTHQQWHIYPNPTDGSISIDISGYEEGTIKQIAIYAITGQIVYSSMPNSQTFEIDMHDYPSGLYLIEITGNSGDVLQTKIIKQ